jgi:hypothetical protein
LRTIINNNRELLLNEDNRYYEYNGQKYIAVNKNIHFITGIFHINYIKNNNINNEYLSIIDCLNGIDIHSYITNIKKKNIINEFTNIKFTKNSYIFLSSPEIENINKITDMEKLSIEIYEKHKITFISSNIMKKHVDMNQFSNYPIDTVLLITKSKQKIYKKKYTNNNLRDNSFDKFSDSFSNKYSSNIISDNDNNNNIGSIDVSDTQSFDNIFPISNEENEKRNQKICNNNNFSLLGNNFKKTFEHSKEDYSSNFDCNNSNNNNNNNQIKKPVIKIITKNIHIPE